MRTWIEILRIAPVSCCEKSRRKRDLSVLDGGPSACMISVHSCSLRPFIHESVDGNVILKYLKDRTRVLSKNSTGHC